MDFSTLKFIPISEVTKPERLLSQGDVVFNNTNSPELVGKTAFYADSEERAFSNHMTRIRVNPFKLRPEFLALVLHQLWREGYFADKCNNHVSQASISRTVLLETEIALPPLSEQDRLVEALAATQETVDRARDRLATIPALLKKFRQSVLAAACSGQLTADWRDKNPHAIGHDLLAHIEAMEGGKGRAATHLEDLELSETPETWAWSTFATLTVNHDGKRKPVKSSDRKDIKGEYRYYGASGVIDYVNDYLFDGSYLLISEDGANLESRTTPIAFQAHGQFWVNNHAHIVQTKAGCPLGFLEVYVESLDLRDYLSGSAQPKLTQAALNSLPVPVPPKDEQVEIVRRVESLFALADSIESRLAEATAQVERTTQAILAKAFRGELTSEVAS
jgi:type I restriction enzyme S subunit